MELYEQLDAIRIAVLDLLKPRTLKVNAVIYGDRARKDQMRPPVIWVFPEDAQILPSGIGEMWTWRCTVAAVVRNEDPDAGRRLADQLAANASAALVASHTLNGTVRKIVRTGYTPIKVEIEKADQVHSSAYTMEAEFRYLEGED